MAYDNANRKNIRNAEKQAALADSNRIAYTRTIMSTTFGREWMHDLLNRCYMFHSPMAVGYPDATAWNIGKQDIGRQLFGDVTTTCPHEYSLMMSEASTKEAANDRRNSEPSSDAGAGSTEEPRRYSAESASFTTDAAGFVIDTTDPGTEDTGAAEGTQH